MTEPNQVEMSVIFFNLCIQIKKLLKKVAKNQLIDNYLALKREKTQRNHQFLEIAHPD